MTNNRPLEEVLRASSLHVLIVLLSKVLSRTGYGDILVLDRRHKLQKSRLGGCELLCQTNIGSVPLKVIIKVIKDSVRVRMLDELAGVCDRTQSDLGILVSTDKLGPKASKSLKEYRRSKVEVIDIQLLAEMLSKFKVGVRPNGDVDYAFFAELEDQLDHVLEFIYEKSRIPR